MPDSAQLISTKNTVRIVGILFIAGTVAGIFSVVPVIVATTPAFALAMLLFSCIFYQKITGSPLVVSYQINMKGLAKQVKLK